VNFSTTSFRYYLLALCGFTLAVGVIVVAATEALVRFGVEPNHNIFQHVAFVENVETECAAFGDSHTALGFSGTEACANLGYPGETFDDTADKLTLLGPTRIPRRIILQADPLMFSSVRLEAGPSIHMTYLTGTDNPDLRILDPLHNPLLIRYWRTAILKQGFSPLFAFHPTGWLAFDEHWKTVSLSERTARAGKEVREQAPVSDFSATTTAARFRKVLIDLDDAGHDVCVVTYPMSSEFNAAARSNPVFDTTIEFFAETAGDTDARYVNMLDWRNHDSTLFANADHLNLIGAREFSKDVLSRCEFDRN
jgi:hypothetical protein